MPNCQCQHPVPIGLVSEMAATTVCGVIVDGWRQRRIQHGVTSEEPDELNRYGTL